MSSWRNGAHKASLSLIVWAPPHPTPKHAAHGYAHPAHRSLAERMHAFFSKEEGLECAQFAPESISSSCRGGKTPPPPQPTTTSILILGRISLLKVPYPLFKPSQPTVE